MKSFVLSPKDSFGLGALEMGSLVAYWGQCGEHLGI